MSGPHTGAGADPAAVAPRSSFSLPPPSELRDRAERYGEHVLRKGRPRKRFMAERRAELVRFVVPTLAVAAALSGIVAVLDVALATFPPDRSATTAEAGAAVVLGAGVAVVLAARRSLVGIVTAHTVVTVLALLAWGVAIRGTGGAYSPYVLVLPLLTLLLAAVVPAPGRTAVAAGLASYAALLVGAAAAPLPLHLVTASVAAGCVVLALSRRRRRLRVFMRTERISAALARLRRVQEQLVVVEKLEALRVLVGGMAHELNNALAVSSASNQQALRDLDHDVELARGALKRSEGGLLRIKKTVGRLRRFAMASEGVLEPADVSAMLDFALESAIGRARSGVIVERRYDPKVGAIECHVAALAEALYQIARNAVEAMPGGGTIAASVRNEGERVVLSVTDEGRGIPPDQIARVFDPFYSRSNKGASKSGLGLSAVYGLVSALGGHVEIRSEVGKGTEVAIVMPARRPSMRPPAPS